MKKLLLASTALVLSAGLAHAQAVTITGEGRMGVQYDDWGFAPSTNYRQEQRLQLNFTVSVQADHGLTFGAFTRARMQTSGVGVANGSGFSGARVWVEASGLRLTFGNVDGALRGAGAAMGYAGGCGIGYEGGQLCADTAGLLNVSQGFNSTGPSANARTRIDYTFGTTRVALSHDRETRNTEVGVRGTFDAFTVAAGYGRSTNGVFSFGTAPGVVPGYTTLLLGLDDVFTLSGHYNGGSWGLGMIATRISIDGAALTGPAGTIVAAAVTDSYTNVSINGNAQLGGGNLYGFVGRYFDGTAAGISYGYGLGGGATVTAGIEHYRDLFDVAGYDRTTASVGVAFTF